jgi:ribosomal subunit interface protein
MQLPLQITFRNMAPSEAIEAQIRERSSRLERFHDRITSCRVLVEAGPCPNKGHLYHLRIDVTVPGSEIVVKRDPVEGNGHEDFYAMLRDGFDAVRRQLEDQAHRARGEVKRHEPHA